MRRSVLGSLAALIVVSLLGCGGGNHASTPVTTSPTATISASSVAFGNQLVNTTSSAQTVSVTNTGNSNLVITAVSVSGGQASDFKLTAPTLPITVVANTSVSFQLIFTPSSRGGRTASLTLTDNAAGSPHSLTLNGSGVAPVVSVGGSSIEFGTRAVSGSTLAKSVAVSNTGDGDLIVSNISVGGTNASDFQLSGSASVTIHPGASANVNVVFKPTTSGLRNGSLIFTDNSSANAHTVASLSGTGMADGPVQFSDAAVTLSPNTIDAPAQFPTTFTVQIVGTDTQFSAGATAADFGPGVTVGDGTSTGLAGDVGLVQVNSPTSATAQITLDTSAAPGPRTIIVTTGGHQSAATFVVPPHTTGPVANVQTLGFVSVGTSVYLDGSGSTVGGVAKNAAARTNAANTSTAAELTYHWTLLHAPNGSTAVLANADSIQPSLVPDKPGTYLIQLTVSDGTSSTATWAVLSTDNSAPVADAGPDQFVALGSLVHLNASNAYDMDGDALLYRWTLVSAPSGSAATLSGSATVAPSFTADASGDYLFLVNVNDGHGNTSSDTVLVSTTGSFPIPNAGPPQKAAVNQSVQLDGSGSSAPNGEPVNCTWTFLSKPASSNAQINNAGEGACSQKASFTVDQPGAYVIQLLVSDAKGHNAVTTTLVNTDPVPPIAIVGPAQNVNVGDTVELDGSKSFDADGDSLTYSWSILSMPSGSTASLSQPTSATPVFVADKNGDYVAQLIVSHGTFASAPSTVLISANSPGFNASPTAITFAEQTVHTTSDSVSIVITNTGAGNLSISQIVIEGANAGDFGYTSAALPVAVGPGATTTVNVTFTPSATGTRAATLTITHNAGASSQISLSGNGVVPGISITPTSLTFLGQVVNTSSSPQSIAVKNIGSGKLIVSSLDLSGANIGDFSFMPISLPITINAGTTSNISIVFKPSAAGNRSAVLSITNNAKSTPDTVSVSGVGTMPSINALPSPVDFHNQATGQASSPITLTISNGGTAELDVSSLTITGANSSDFAIVPPPTLPLKVAVGQNTTINLVFTPSAAGNRTASLAIGHNAGSSPLNVSLGGTGVAPGITPSPSPVNFGDLLVGSANPAAQTLTITNSGTAPLVITGVAIAGANSADFGFGSGFVPPTQTNPITVAPGSATSIVITFLPSGEGTRTAVLSITANVSATVTLSGNGTAPHVSLSTTSVPFGDQNVDSASSPVTIKLTNTGTASLSVSRVDLIGSNPGDFVVGSLTTPFVVAPGAAVNLTATFKPTALGSRSAQISVVTNASDSPHLIALSGTGTGVPPQISPTSILFSDRLVGTTSGASTVSINNPHSTPISVSNVELVGTNPGDFAFSPATTSFIVPAQGSASIAVTFSPSATGARAAILRITNNTGVSDITLSGNGIAPGISFSPTSVSFGKQLISTTSQPMTVTITNTGTAPLLINNISVNGNNGSDFSATSSPTPFAIQPQQSATVTTKFTPSTSTDESASIVISDNTSVGTHSIGLTGTGTAPTISANPNPLAFGNQLKGTSSNSLTLTISNAGTGDLLISNLAITGPNAGDFTTTTAPVYPIVVAAGANGSIALVFKPTTTGAEGATLTITSNAPRAAVALSGTGTSPQITFTPATTLAFGTQLQNTASAVSTLTITNPGTADLNITNVAFGGTNASDFALDRSLTYPLTVPANGSTTIGVIFTPKTANAETATLAFTDNADNSPQMLSLTGTGIAPGIGPLSPINFGSVNVGDISSIVSLTVTNPGTAPLHITSLSFGGANAGDFSTTAVTPIVVQPNGGTVSIGLRFSPTDKNLRVATLQLTDDAAGSPHSASLSGTGIGVPKFAVSPASLDFGSIADGNTTPPQALTITNKGTADLLIDHLVKTGNGGDFLYSVVGSPNNDFPATLTPGSSLTVNVSFKPSDPGGTRSAMLIFQDAANTTLGTVSVTGVGIPPSPQISLSVTALTFPATPHGISSAPLGIVVTNNGTADLNISALTITGPNAGDFSVTPAAPVLVAKGGGTATLNVRFMPTALGARSATLAITNNAGNTIQDRTVTLSGTGQDLGRLNLQPATLGKDLELLAIGSITVAPTSNLSITISSSDPTKLLLSPLSTDASGTNVGVASFVGVLPAGKGINGNGFPAFWIQALASSGTVQITMDAPGYTSASATITLTPSGFVLLSPAGIGSNFTTQLSAADSNLSISSAQLDAGGNVLLTDQKLRGGLNVSLDITDATPATGTITGTPVSLTGGSSSTTAGAIKFHPVGVGTTLLSVNQPPTFTTPVSGAQVTVTVRSPSITLTPTIVGYNLQVLGNGTLNTPAPTGGIQVTISSSDQTKVLLSTSPTVLGSASITVTVGAGSTTIPTYYIQGLVSSGSTTLTASAAGYTSATATVVLNPSGFVINSQDSKGQFTAGDFVTTTLSSPTALQVSVWQLNSSNVPVTAGQIRGGVSAPVQVVSGTTATGTILSGSVTFQGGDYAQNGMSFQPASNCNSPCTSVLSVTYPTGYAMPTTGGSITATVTMPAVTLRLTQTTIGNNLQALGSGALDVPAPSDLTVTITSNNPNVLLSASPTAAGSSTITLTVFQGGGVNSIGFPSYYIQALGASGTAQLTISAPGFSSSNATVNMASSGFVLEGLNGVGGNFGVLLSNGNVVLTVRAAVLDQAGNPTLLYQPVRGGFSASVTVSSTAPGVATLAGTPLQVTSNNAMGTVTLQPQAVGQTTISIDPPVGYARPASGDHFTVTVN